MATQSTTQNPNHLINNNNLPTLTHITIYAEFPKGMQLKGRKLGQWPELSLDIAREKTQETAKEGLTAESVQGF